MKYDKIINDIIDYIKANKYTFNRLNLFETLINKYKGANISNLTDFIRFLEITKVLILQTKKRSPLVMYLIDKKQLKQFKKLFEDDKRSEQN